MTHSCSATSQPNRSSQHAYRARCRRSPGLGFDQHLEPAVDYVFEVEGHGFMITHRHNALVRHHPGVDAIAVGLRLEHNPGKYHWLAGLPLAKRENGCPNVTLRSSPAHSRYSSVPWSRQILPAPSRPCGSKPADSSWGRARQIHRHIACVNPALWLHLQSIIVGDCTNVIRAAGEDEAISNVECLHLTTSSCPSRRAGAPLAP